MVFIRASHAFVVERSSSERASRIPPSLHSFLLWGAKLASSWLQDRIFVSIFFRVFSQDASKLRFLAFSDGFSMDLGGFGRDLGVFLHYFPGFFQNKAYSLKNNVFHRENQ